LRCEALRGLAKSFLEPQDGYRCGGASLDLPPPRFVLTQWNRIRATERKRDADEQIIGFIRQADAGVAVADLCRKEGFSSATF
jgi:hypothetical protein